MKIASSDILLSSQRGRHRQNRGQGIVADVGRRSTARFRGAAAESGNAGLLGTDAVHLSQAAQQRSPANKLRPTMQNCRPKTSRKWRCWCG